MASSMNCIHYFNLQYTYNTLDVPTNFSSYDFFRFIRTYGTHIIVEIAVGGQDVICVKQSHSSTISSADLKLHLEDLGDFLFSDGKNLSPIHRKTKDGKSKV
jgi:hypothetical protein